MIKNIPFAKISQNSFAIVPVTVAAGATSGTASGSGTIVGYYPSAEDQMIQSITISGGTITVTLVAAAVADNVINVVLVA